MQRFALIGAAGYIAPRHLQAIRDTGNQLVVAYDVNDSVGIMDSYFPDAAFFTVAEKFESFLDNEAVAGQRLDYISICSPNDLHAPHMRTALRHGADAICEKPLVLDAAELDTLRIVERETGKKIYTILQLRLHDSVIALKQKIADELAANPGKRFAVDLTYLTSRGSWYFASWKGELRRSGGIATNIGIHFFDMLTFLFGDVQDSRVHASRDDAAAGVLSFRNADVRWFLSVNEAYLPDAARAANKRTYRSIQFDGDEFEFSEGFTDLHTRSYEAVLGGRGFGLDVAEPSVRLANDIRTMALSPLAGDYHPLAQKL